MKKKKITRKNISHKSKHSVRIQKSFRDYNWVIYVGSCVALFVLVSLVVALSHRRALTQTVAGISIAKGFFAQATIPLPSIPGASAYNIYYWDQVHPGAVNAVRNISSNISSYTISYLKKNTQYEYKISAIDWTDNEFWWSPVSDVANIVSM